MIDFSIPWWLIVYYHVIGVFSLILDAFSIYLVLFKSSKIDNFRHFLLNFQIACSFTDIHMTFSMQPVPLYPLIAGYSMGVLPTYFGVSTHFCMTVIVFCYIYQIESMIFCFVKKHQSIADTLKKYKMPKFLVISLFCFFAFDILAVVVSFFRSGVPRELQDEYVRKNFPEHFSSFQSLPNFSIYELNSQFIATVVFAVTCGIVSFFILILILLNIFRMLALLKVRISASSYRKHKAAIISLGAQFATSSVCVVPPLFFVFVAFVGVHEAQVIVELLLVIACFHSSLNVLVLVTSYPTYRKYVMEKLRVRGGKNVISNRASILVSRHVD